MVDTSFLKIGFLSVLAALVSVKLKPGSKSSPFQYSTLKNGYLANLMLSTFQIRNYTL